MKRATPVLRFVAAVGILSAFAASAFAQSGVQELRGEYVGLSSFGFGTTPSGVQLAIDERDNRSFTGTFLPYIEQENLLVKGTIAASGNCTIQATNDDGQATLKLDWLNLSGAGVLTGQVVVNHEEQATGPIALLRPFANPGVNWGDGFAEAEFRSHTGGVNFGVPIDFLTGTKGAFAAAFAVGGEAFEIVASSNTDGEVVAVGVSGSLVITIAGQVKINERGEPTGMEATYLIESASGKLVDTGIIAILIGLR